MVKESKKQLIELEEAKLSSRFKLEPTFDWLAFPALTWAYYTLSSESFGKKITTQLSDALPLPEKDSPLFWFSPGWWIIMKALEPKEEGG